MIDISGVLSAAREGTERDSTRASAAATLAHFFYFLSLFHSPCFLDSLPFGGGNIPDPRRLFRRDNKSGAGHYIPTPPKAKHTFSFFMLAYVIDIW